ncbi:antibiotic biosynthesis monooxygenase [Desulfovibrio sp. JY]|nr:antibiotic biosynthesis monooxygenase [Desulfovibrio sp. JY]
MVAREWKCLCPPVHRDGFLAHLAATGVAETSVTPGYRGHQILTRKVDGLVEVTFVSYWESLAAIEAFAGADIGRAVLYPGDDAYEIVPETVVRHFEVVAATLV